MKWKCGRKVDQICPVWKEKSIAENIELIDCMNTDCPYLTIEGYERVPPTSCVGPAGAARANRATPDSERRNEE